MAFPLLLFLVMIGSLFSYGLTRWTFGGLLNQGVFQLILIIGAFTWFYPARIVRSQIQSLRSREFVEAAQMVGARTRASCARTCCRTSCRRSSPTGRC